MDPIVESAIRKRDELLDLLSKIKHQIEKLDEFISIARKLEEDSPPPTLPLPLEEPSKGEPDSPLSDGGVQNSEGVARENPHRRPRTRSNPSPAAVMEGVLDILRHAERPQTRSQLLESLAERGIRVEGHDPAKVLGTNIWRYMKRTDEIMQSGEGYWLSGRPLPE